MLSLGACFSSHCTLLMRTFIHSRVRTPVRVSCIPHPLQWISNLTARWLYVYVCVCDCAQVCIILVITTIATGSVVTGLRSGLKTLSQVTFILGNILLFSLLFLDNTWYDAVSVVVTQCVLADCCLVRCCVSAHITSFTCARLASRFLLNSYVQSLGHYVQYVIMVGSQCDTWEQLSLEFKTSAQLAAGYESPNYLWDSGPNRLIEPLQKATGPLCRHASLLVVLVLCWRAGRQRLSL